EDNRCMSRLLSFVDQRGCLEAVQDRHIHVQNDQSEFLIQKHPKSVKSRFSPDKILVEIGQKRLERDQILDMVIDQQNADFSCAHTSVLWPAHNVERKHAISSNGRILSTATESIAAFRI